MFTALFGFLDYLSGATIYITWPFILMVHADNHYCNYPVTQLQNDWWMNRGFGCFLAAHQGTRIHLHFAGVFVHLPSQRKPVLRLDASNSKRTQNITLSIHLFHRRSRCSLPLQNLLTLGHFRIKFKNPGMTCVMDWTLVLSLAMLLS